tara:strand:- start:3618 stop:3944 length:327 start_codon:yes stop_codon:yes gene_type:complete
MASGRRYLGVKSKRKTVTSNYKKVQSPEHMETTYYEKAPEENSDIYFIAQEGDRFDHLAHRIYNDAKLWWFIARTNNMTTMNIPAGTQIRVPASPKHAKIKPNKGKIY